MARENIFSRLGRGLSGFGAGIQDPSFAITQARQRREEEQRRQLGQILYGQTIPAFARPGGAEPLPPEQIRQSQLAQLAQLGTPEATNILTQLSPLMREPTTPFTTAGKIRADIEAGRITPQTGQQLLQRETGTTPLDERKQQFAEQELAFKQRELKSKENIMQLRQNLLGQFTSTQDRGQIRGATSAITNTGNLNSVIDQAGDRLNKAAQFAAVTGDVSLLKGAQAQYDLAVDKFERRTGKDVKDAEFKAAGFFDRMQSAEQNVGQIGEAGLPTVNVELISGTLGDTLANFARTPAQQTYVRAANDWIRAKLRKESGAVIGDQEMKDEFRTYFPVVGDSPQVIQAKTEARQIATRNMQRAGNRALRLQAPANLGAGAGQLQPPRTQANTQAAGQQAEGTIATNPQTGERLILRGRQWQPL